jgi:hypothetical protein
MGNYYSRKQQQKQQQQQQANLPPVPPPPRPPRRLSSSPEIKPLKRSILNEFMQDARLVVAPNGYLQLGDIINLDEFGYGAKTVGGVMFAFEGQSTFFEKPTYNDAAGTKQGELYSRATVNFSGKIERVQVADIDEFRRRACRTRVVHHTDYIIVGLLRTTNDTMLKTSLDARNRTHGMGLRARRETGPGGGEVFAVRLIRLVEKFTIPGNHRRVTMEVVPAVYG